MISEGTFVYRGGKLDFPRNQQIEISVEPNSDASWFDLFAEFLSQPQVEQVNSLKIGHWLTRQVNDWGDDGIYTNQNLLEAVTQSGKLLTNLKSLSFTPSVTQHFIDDFDVTFTDVVEDFSGDITVLFLAFPQLESIKVVGRDVECSLIESEKLTSCSLCCDQGTAYEVILNSNLPNLVRLRLMGLEESLATLFQADFPSLKSLKLDDWYSSDSLVGRLVNAPCFQQLEELDLSGGTLGNDGANLLISALASSHLKTLTIHHHFIHLEVVQKLTALAKSLNIQLSCKPADLTDCFAQDPEEWFSESVDWYFFNLDEEEKMNKYYSEIMQFFIGERFNYSEQERIFHGHE
jgi:hypothetical protein